MMKECFQYAILALLGYATIDFAVFVIASLRNLPCGFTEWVCYPFWWPAKWLGFDKGVSMRTGIVIRFLETACMCALVAILTDKVAA